MTEWTKTEKTATVLVSKDILNLRDQFTKKYRIYGLTTSALFTKITPPTHKAITIRDFMNKTYK